ncbi:MAG: hypothetical protein ABIK15_06100 [Pseudomonadota bacterium]
MFGIEKLAHDLTEIGYQPEKIKVNDLDFVVIDEFLVELGRFKGRNICLGIQATKDFPRSAASAIHVKASPQLFEKKDSIKNVRNIIDSPLGPDWRYWSHNFKWKENSSTRRLVNQIKGIFARA